MDKAQILEAITEIFRRELSDPGLNLDYNSSTNTVEKWDSINNLVLISAIEDHFKMSFSVDAIFAAENVGDLCDYILQEKKTNA